MTAYTLIQLVYSLARFYNFLVLVYCLMTFFPLKPGGLAEDVFMALNRICGPWLNLFRRFIPPVGGIDFSPVVAIIALQLVVQLVVNLLLGIL